MKAIVRFIFNQHARRFMALLAMSSVDIAGCSQQQNSGVTPGTELWTGADIEKISEEQSLSPYFVVLSEDSKTEQLPLKSTNVDVKITGVIADVTVHQKYSNTGNTPIEAIYLFPASTRAAVYDMKMKINDREIIAVVEEKQQARHLYSQAKKKGHVASLLEQQRPNVFQMKVANIVSGATVDVSLSYTELLVPTSGIYEFVYPTVVGPRYVNKAKHDSDQEDWTANPYLHEKELPTYSFSIDALIETGISIKQIRSTTHKVNTKFEKKTSARIHLRDTEQNSGNRDFVLQYRLTDNQIETGFLTYEDPLGEQYFLAMVQPPARVPVQMVPAREYVFIVDVSGSMNGFPLSISKKLMEKLLSSLAPTDRFNMVFFAGGSKTFAKSSLPATKENIRKAIHAIENANGGGGTELINALEKSLALKGTENFSRTFIILTDGYVSVEKDAFELIRKNLGTANFFSFGIGTSVNRHIIEGMAHCGKGEPFIVLRPDQADKTVDQFINYVSSPVLTNVNMEFSQFESYDVLPDQYPDVFAERPLIITGRYKGRTEGVLKIDGTNGEGKYQQTRTIEQNTAQENRKAIKYLWAREKIRQLTDYHKVSYKSDLESEIVELGKKYNLLTEFTSFIAIDSEISNSDSSLTSIKQPLPLPQGVTDHSVAPALQINRLNSGKYALSDHSVAFEVEEDFDLIIYEEDEEVVEEHIFTIVEEMPKFQGGDLSDFREYIQANIQYPEKAIEMGIEGRVFIQFIVDTAGYIKDAKVIRGIDPLLDEAALNAIKASPRWLPAKQRRKPVDISYIIPIDFKISGKNNDG